MSFSTQPQSLTDSNQTQQPAYTFDENDKSWFLHFDQPDPEEEQKAIKAQFNNGVFIPPNPFPEQPKNPEICTNFLCGMCLNGGLCTHKHEFISEEDENNDDNSVENEPLFPFIITRSQILQNIENIRELTGLYVVYLNGLSVQSGGLCQQLMRVDNVVEDCFSPGRFGSPYGLVLSVEGNADSEVVVRIDQIADYFDKYEKKALVERYLDTVVRMNCVQFNDECLAPLSYKIQYFELKSN